MLSTSSVNSKPVIPTTQEQAAPEPANKAAHQADMHQDTFVPGNKAVAVDAHPRLHHFEAFVAKTVKELEQGINNKAHTAETACQHLAQKTGEFWQTHFKHHEAQAAIAKA